jgi:hypothetical protein
MQRRLEAAAVVRAPIDAVDRLLATESTAILAHHEAEVRLGRPTRDGDGRSWVLDWRPTPAARLLRLFQGTLSAQPDGCHTVLRIRGEYWPPRSRVGAFGDGVVGHRMARISLGAFLDAVAARVDAMADEREVRGPGREGLSTLPVGPPRG